MEAFTIARRDATPPIAELNRVFVSVVRERGTINYMLNGLEQGRGGWISTVKSTAAPRSGRTQ